MAIEICPLADEVGNLADWVSVGVGALAAIATTAVAVLAYKTSDRAANIADDAKRIAQQQHDQSVELKENIARTLGSLLQVEICTLPMKLGVLLREFDAAVQPIKGRNTPGDGKLNAVFSDMNTDFLPASHGALDRVHNLPGKLGADVASMIGMTRDIGILAVRVRGRVRRISDMSGGHLIIGYNGDMADFDSLRLQLVSMLSFSIRLAESFNRFAQGEVIDYTEEKALVSD